MNGNFENILIKKEIVEGVAETPTKAYSVKTSGMNTKNETMDLAQIEGTIFSPSTIIKGKKTVSGSLDSYANTEILGTFLNGVLGGSTSVTVSGVTTHSFDVNVYDLPSYTIETTKGNTVNRSLGCKMNTVTISNEDSAITANCEVVGLRGVDSESILNVATDVITFLNEVAFVDTDTVELYNIDGTLIESGVSITSIDGKDTITIGSTNAVVGGSISLTIRQPSETASKRPVRFYGDTSVKVNANSANEKEVGVTDITLNINNNIKVDEGFRSGSYYSQANNQGMRTIDGTFTIYSEEVVPFITAQKTGEKIKISVKFDGDLISGTSTKKSLFIVGDVIITEAPIDVTAGETLISNIGFKFTGFDTFELVDEQTEY